MNLVRGVSAFLRKSSHSHSNSERHSDPGESLVQQASWPEIEFSKDGDEALLIFLWDGYEEVSGQEDSQKALELFLVSFDRVFESWIPEEEPEDVEVLSRGGETESDSVIDRRGISMGGGAIEGCKQGHPTKVIVGLIQELKGTTRSLNNLHANPDGSMESWLSPSEMEAALRLLHAITILTRSFHNRRIYSYFGGLQTLMGVMKSAVFQLKGAASVVLSGGVTSLAASMQLSFLQCLLTHIVSSVANYIDAEARVAHKFGMPVTSLEPILLQRTVRDVVSSTPERSPAPSRTGSRRSASQRRSSNGTDTSGSQRMSGSSESPGERSGRETLGITNGSVPLLETGGLNWFVELLRILRKLRLKGMSTDTSLEVLTLRTLKSTIVANPRTQNHFRSIGGLKVLLDGLGTPATPSDRRRNGQEEASPAVEGHTDDDAREVGVSSLSKLLEDFEMQILSLQVLREAVFRNVTSLQSLRDHGGVQKYIEVIRWAAFTFPDMDKRLNSFADASSNTMEGTAGLPGALLEHQGSKESRQRRKIKATPSGFLSTMLNVNDYFMEDSVKTSVGQVRIQDDQDSTVQGDNLQGWNWRVADLCRILCSFLVPAGDVLNLARGLQGGQEGVGTSVIYWELATKCIVNVLLGVFRGADDMGHENKALQASRLLSSTLQHYTLYVLKKFLEVSPTALQLFREDRVWDVMFSEYFFYLGLGDCTNMIPARNEGAAVGGSSPGQENSAQRHEDDVRVICSQGSRDVSYSHIPESVDTEPLRLEVISFVELAATVNGTSDNLPECSALLEALQQCCLLASIPTMLAKSLHRVLQLASDATIRSFQLLDATTVLSQVMEHQRQAAVKLGKESLSWSFVQSDSEDKSLTEVDLWLHACGAVFALFAEYFAVSEEAVYEAARNSKAVDALLGLLWESKTQAFALRHILLLMKLPPVVEQDKEAKLELCLKYLESLPRAQVECRGTDISLVLDLLAGLRDVLQIDQGYYQGLFHDGECFVHIVSLLNEDHSREAGVQLSLEVINTLTHLLQGNEASKASFCCLVCPGYKTLQSLLLERHQGKPSRGLLKALLDMLVDGGFQIPTNMLIQNEDVVLLFFNLLQKCEAGDQVFGLDIFHTLLEESTANRSSCVRAGLLIVLLDWFAMEQSESLVVKVAQLMQMIGGHSISGKDMRRIFALLRGTKDGSRPRHGTLLLQILRGMLKESGPAVFFELSGRDSGIVVTTPLRWPTNRGYSFCCWARVESFPPLSSQRAEDGMMGLFSFLSEAGKGCTALLCDDQLTVESISSKRQTISMTVGLQVKRWYFICITHSTGRALAGGNSLKVFLDGELKTSEKLRYPKVNEFLTRCTVGASAPLPSVNGSDIDTFSGKYSAPFCGQLGPMYLFDDVMSSEQVMAVYSLGPGYMYSFLSSEVGCVPVNVSTQSVIDSKEGLASKMIFGFNAQASAGRALFDVSSVLEQSSDGVIHGATIMAGTLLCYRHLVQDIVHCVGGIDVFFPLLTQLDQPVSDSLVILDSRGKQYWQSPLEGHVAVEVLELVTAVLDGNLSNQQYMHNICGMSVLGCLLQSVSPQHLTVKVVSSLERLLETVRRANGALLSEQLVKEALQKLFLNPHIWLFTPFIVQRELYTSLLNYGETDGNQLHHVCGLPKVLDTLRQFYWDKPKSRRALGTKPLLHPGTKTVIGERPSQSEVAKLRLLVLGLAEIALRHQVTLLDVKALVAFTEGSEDIVSLEDVLHMVLGLLGRKSLALAFADHVNTLGGCQIFMSLLKRQQESIRLLGIRLIGALLITNTLEKKGFGGTIMSTLKNVTDFQSRLDKQKSSFIFALMTDRIMTFPFTDVVRATLFDIMLGGASPKQVLQGGPSKPELLKHPSKNKRDNMAESISQIGERSTLSTFVLPQLLGVILKLMVGCDDMLLRMEILKDILRLLKANPANSEALTMEPYWQGWLFTALVSSTKRTKQLAGDSAEETLWLLGVEEVLIRSILCTFHVHCVCTLRGGWRHVERTINYIHMYADEGRLSKFHALHAILGDLFEAMVQGLPLQASLFAHPCRDNVLYLLALVDELVMGDAFRLLPFPFTGDSITDDTTDNSLLSGEYIDVGFSTTVKPASRRKSAEEISLLSGAQGARRKLTVNRSCGWQRRTSQGEVIDLSSKDQYWRLYGKVWSLLIAMNGRGMSSKGNFHLTSPAGPISLGQRARGLVESINIPASEMAAVVSGGLGAVGIGSGGKLVDKSFRMRGEKCPRVVFRLVLLYLFEGDLESASRCVQQFLALLPGFLSTENEQNKNRLQLLLWTLVDARAQIGAMDNGARYLVVSQLISETMEGGKNMLATSLADKDKTREENSTSEFPLHNLLQQDRVMSAVKEDARYLKATTAQRSNEVEALRVEVNEFSTQEVQQRKFLDDQSHSVLTVICSGDRSRRSSAQLAYDEEQQAISEHWCHMFRDLTDERGPWSAVSFPNDIVTRWKLDKTEDPSRRRLKLKRNYHFNEELMRPVTRSPASKPDEPVNEPGSTVDLLLGGVRTFLLKGLRGVSEETYSDDEEVSDEDLDTDFSEGDSVENGLKEADQGGDVTEVTDEATPSPQQLHMAAVGDGGEEEVLLSVVCILVAPKRKVAGRLEVMRSSLHFYGEFVVEGTGGQSVFTRSGGLNYPDGISTETPEKGSLKPKINFREKSSTEGGDFEKGNAMERLDPMQQCTTHGGPSKDVKRHRRWDLCQVKAVHATRHLLQNSALEIFFTNSRPPVFINFPSQRVSKDVGTTIIYLRNGPSSGKSSLKDKEDMILYVDKRKAYDLAEKARDKWHRREMNNFDYLMTLNTLSGRSYNDLTQYPVFPWVLADYSSEKLDFSNPTIFRDLSKPIGALDMKRFKVFEERYQNFSDPDIPSFYYGSHYSSMGIVLFYLLRLEPFTSFHRQLQGGKFDHADRLFHSIEGAFRNCLTHTSDVKELIPEFFYLPEFLINSNEYYLGVKQDGEQLGAVVLPPWAKGSAEEFVRKNREALESEYVSEHLHEWVDLIFGCKQRGRPAVEAANVFYHLTYEGAVDLEAMDSALERSAVEDQIANFGQTPMQLFKKKHHKRGPPIPIARPLYYAPASIALTSYINSSLASPIMYVGLIGSKVVTINGNLGMTVRPWMTPSIQSSGGSFTFSSSQDLFFSVGPDISVSRKLGGPFGEDVAVTPSCFGTLQVRSSFFLLTCGHWDNSFKVISLNDGRMVQSNCQHKDVVTCLSVAVDGSVVVTGSRDTTVMVWDIELTSGSGHRRIGSSREPSTEKPSKSDSVVITDKPRHVLCGHDDAVTCIAVRVELDIVISGSKDATCIFHSLRDGSYIRSLKHPNGSPITRMSVSQNGLLVVYSNADLSLNVYSINGKLLASTDCKGQVNGMDISWCGDFLICGGDQGLVVVRNIHTLETVRKYDGTQVPISSLTATPEDCFLVGTQDGSLLVFSLEIQHQKKGNFFASRARALVPGNLIPGS